MNILINLLLAIMMAAAATPANPLIQALYEGMVEEAAEQPEMSVSYSDNSIVMTFDSGLTSEELAFIDPNAVKAEMIEQMRGGIPDICRQALLDEGTKIIIRFQGVDGSHVDVTIKPAEWE